MFLDKIRFRKEVGISRQAPALGLVGHSFGFEAIAFAEGKREKSDCQVCTSSAVL